MTLIPLSGDFASPDAIAFGRWLECADQLRTTWQEAVGMDSGVLVGGIALAFYTRPQFVDEIVFIYADPANRPAKATGFHPQGLSAMIDGSTGTKVRLIAPDDHTMPQWLARKVFETAIVVEETRIASFHGMLALKLAVAAQEHGQWRQNRQDIINMFTWNREAHPGQMSPWNFDTAQTELLSELMSIARS